MCSIYYWFSFKLIINIIFLFINNHFITSAVCKNFCKQKDKSNTFGVIQVKFLKINILPFYIVENFIWAFGSPFCLSFVFAFQNFALQLQWLLVLPSMSQQNSHNSTILWSASIALGPSFHVQRLYNLQRNWASLARCMLLDFAVWIFVFYCPS